MLLGDAGGAGAAVGAGFVGSAVLVRFAGSAAPVSFVEPATPADSVDSIGSAAPVNFVEPAIPVDFGGSAVPVGSPWYSFPFVCRVFLLLNFIVHKMEALGKRICCGAGTCRQKNTASVCPETLTV